MGHRFATASVGGGPMASIIDSATAKLFPYPTAPKMVLTALVWGHRGCRLAVLAHTTGHLVECEAMSRLRVRVRRCNNCPRRKRVSRGIFMIEPTNLLNHPERTHSLICCLFRDDVVSDVSSKSLMPLGRRTTPQVLISFDADFVPAPTRIRHGHFLGIHLQFWGLCL